MAANTHKHQMKVENYTLNHSASYFGMMCLFVYLASLLSAHSTSTLAGKNCFVIELLLTISREHV